MKIILIICSLCTFLAGCVSVNASGPPSTTSPTIPLITPTTSPTVQPSSTQLPTAAITRINVNAPTAPPSATASTTNPAGSTIRATATPTLSGVTNSQVGFLQGHANIGPLVPVERFGDPTPIVPPEMYAARSLNIFQADGSTLVMNVKFDSNGNYRVALNPGVYVVALAKSGIDRGNDLPARITIESGKTIQLDISIDTGIR